MMWLLLLSSGLSSCFGQPAPVRASLLQSGGKGKASSASSSGSTSVALAGFQTYAEGLAAKFLEDGAQPDAAMIDQIDVVIAWIDTIYSHLKDAHQIDFDNMNKCPSKVQGCAPNNSAVQLYEALVNNTNTKRGLHKKCREDDRNCTTQVVQACINYDVFRQTDAALLSTQASCAASELSDDYIRADEDDANNMLADMESCLVKFKSWHEELYSRYQACKRAPCKADPEDCQLRRADFESMHCEMAIDKDSICSNFDTCVTREQKKCTNLCDDVAIDVSARKADNETGERIKCLLIVLRDKNDAEKPTALADCTEATYLTDEFNIECLAVGDPIAGIDCETGIPHVSCSKEFFQNEYKDIEHVKECDCQHQCVGLGQPDELPSCDDAEAVNVEVDAVGVSCPNDYRPMTQTECMDGVDIDAEHFDWSGRVGCWHHYLPGRGCFREGDKALYSTCERDHFAMKNHAIFCTKLTKAPTLVPTAAPTPAPTPVPTIAVGDFLQQLLDTTLYIVPAHHPGLQLSVEKAGSMGAKAVLSSSTAAESQWIVRDPSRYGAGMGGASLSEGHVVIENVKAPHYKNLLGNNAGAMMWSVPAPVSKLLFKVAWSGNDIFTLYCEHNGKFLGPSRFVDGDRLQASDDPAYWRAIPVKSR